MAGGDAKERETLHGGGAAVRPTTKIVCNCGGVGFISREWESVLR